jgi:small-conductance mechanosensitive channel
MSFSIGGYNIKGWVMAVAVPVLSTISGGIYFGYDTLNRFYGVEAGVGESLDNIGKLNSKTGSMDKRITSVETVAQRNLTEVNNKLSGNASTLEGKLIVRIQTLEQAIADNDVRGLSQKLAQLTTNMQQILEQQKLLLDLRSQVDKATTITDGLGNTLDTLQIEVDDIWKAYDELADNPL